MHVVWSTRALRQLARMERSAADQVRRDVARFAVTGIGPTKVLKGSLAGILRLRSGDWRIFLARQGETLTVTAVKNRSEAYR